MPMLLIEPWIVGARCALNSAKVAHGARRPRAQDGTPRRPPPFNAREAGTGAHERRAAPPGQARQKAAQASHEALPPPAQSTTEDSIEKRKRVLTPETLSSSRTKLQKIPLPPRCLGGRILIVVGRQRFYSAGGVRRVREGTTPSRRSRSRACVASGERGKRWINWLNSRTPPCLSPSSIRE